YYRLGLQVGDSKISWTGAQDQGIWKHTKDAGSAFRGLGDGFQVALNPQNANEVLALGPNGELYRSTSGGTISSFVSVSSQFNDGADWDAPLKIGNKSPYTRWLGRASMWKSADGQSWAKTTGSAGFTNNSPIRSIAINPYNNNIVWAGGYDKVVKTTNAGNEWTVTAGIPAVVVTSIQLVGSDINFAVISLASTNTTTARVFVTTNGGESWSNKSGSGLTGLPGAICWSIALDSLNPKSIWYAATDFGMYYTRDGGTTWSVAGSGIGLAPCWDVALHPNKATLRVATFGRGLWEANTNVLPVEFSSLTAVPRDLHTELNWSTDSERNTWRFVVRRSFENGEFEEIGEVPAAGESNTRKHYAFNDPKIDNGHYLYQIKTVDLDGSESFSNFVEVRRGEAASGLRMDQNYPNPFFLGKDANATPTRIRFYLPQEGHVSIKVFSSIGQLVTTLVDGTLQAGENNVFWNGRDAQGITVAAGTYFYVLETSTGEQVWSKMIVHE
ncbi:MAG TPA: FlgD immunoglobulin-like domain containing protein, partial [Candidatus Kapabacteria bacterium]|nr:FlgD immunoglobulin-like domain containing protein [Candidatus Kapabacteria bacterium]